MRELEVHGVHVLRYTCIATKVLSILCSSSSSTVWNPYQHHLINTLKTVKCCSARRIFKDFSPITSATDLPKFGISHLDLPLGPPTLRKKDRPTSHPHICANDKRWCTKKPKVSSSFYLWGKENLSHGESLTFFVFFYLCGIVGEKIAVEVVFKLCTRILPKRATFGCYSGHFILPN